jgi:hypothetical protein
MDLGGGNAAAIKPNLMSNEVAARHYPYLGPLGEVVRHGQTFSASKNAFPVGTYNTFGEAMASLEWKGRVKATFAR